MALHNVPFTTSVTNHGLLIRFRGKPVGAITKWSTSQSRAEQAAFEFGNITTGGGGSGEDVLHEGGEPFEIVPGVGGAIQLSIDRYDIWGDRFEQAFGSLDLTMLTRQKSPISLVEYWASPSENDDDEGGNLSFSNVYYGCWFTQLGRQQNAEGQKIVMANASLRAARIRQLK